MEKNRIYNFDYKYFLRLIPDKSVDFICIDPPYGKINGMQLSVQKEKMKWDRKINWIYMFFKQFNRILKDGRAIAVFGQQPTYSEMIRANIKNFKYEFIWKKNNAAQGFNARIMPLIYTENIVFL